MKTSETTKTIKTITDGRPHNESPGEVSPGRPVPLCVCASGCLVHPAYAATTTVRSAPCNCLTKEYLQDGSVLFKDLCTKEAAILAVEEMRAKAQAGQ